MILALHFYMLLVVYSYYKELREKEITDTNIPLNENPPAIPSTYKVEAEPIKVEMV